MLKKILFVLGCAMTYYGTAKANPFAVRDSIGVTSQNGRTYITHRVEAKETLFALSRKYGVPVAQIVASNKLVNQSISIGQIVLVPMKAGASVASTATASVPRTVSTTASPAAAPTATAAPSASATAAGKTYVVDSNGNKVHTVQARQTLYAISRMYGVTVENIKKWNNLTANTVAIGVNLIVGTGEKATTQTAAKAPIYVPEHDEEVSMPKQAGTATTTTRPAATTARPTTTSTTTTASAPVTAPKSTATSPAAKPVTTPAASATTPATPATAAKPATETPSKTSEYTSRVNESGMAEQIDQRSDASKFLALHKTAPVGTIMAVKNPENNQTVYVRVIGKLPDTGENENVVVKISKKACQQIGVVDKRFRVELSYMP